MREQRRPRPISNGMDFAREAEALLRANRRTEGTYSYTVPSPGTYPYQWLWDSCFHAILLASFDPAAAKNELRSLISRQFQDGMIPHIIFWKPKLSRPYDWGWGGTGTSSITQPPMLAYALWEIHRRTGDTAFLEEMYASTLAFYTYFIGKRDPQDHHLAGIINPDESGEDNSPRFDIPMRASADISSWRHLFKRRKLVYENKVCNFDAELCMSKNFWVKDVPFNTILIKNLEVLGHIASLLGDAEGEHFATLHAGLIKNAMRDRLFADGVFYSAMNHDYQPLKVETWAHFAPLFADLYTPGEAESLVHNHLRNKETFRGRFGIRTVSKQEPSYRPDGFWRGPVWMAPNWFMYKGLIAYGLTEDAKWIRETSLELIERNGFREYFDSDTGRGHGAYNFTWGALILDMMES